MWESDTFRTKNSVGNYIWLSKKNINSFSFPKWFLNFSEEEQYKGIFLMSLNKSNTNKETTEKVDNGMW